MKFRTTLGAFSCIIAFGFMAWAVQDSPPKAGQPRYYKGNLHTHSLWSDGDDFPEMIADWYKTKGYDFLALTEHNVIAAGDRWIDADKGDTRKEAVKKARDRFGNDWVEIREKNGKSQVRLKTLVEVRKKVEEEGKFLMIPAEEITHHFQSLPVHMNAINLGEVIKPVNGTGVAETISVNLRQVEEKRRKAGQPSIAFLNHPNFQWGVNADDMIRAPELTYFEVYNGHPGTNQNGDAKRPSVERMWDLVLAKRLTTQGGSLLRGVATDDSHNYHVRAMNKPTPGRGWVMVRANQLTNADIMAGLETGDFYSSTGVVLADVQSRGKTLSVTITPTKGVNYITEYFAALKTGQIGVVVTTSTETQSSYTLTGKELYVRARVVSTKDHPNPSFAKEKEMAWTQPLVP